MTDLCIKKLISILICSGLVAGAAVLGQPAEAQTRLRQGKPKVVTLSPRLRPDLKVAKVWMGKDCRIRVHLSNAGRGPLVIKSDRQIALGIRLDHDKVRLFTFKQVDPKGKLIKPGGEVIFIAPRLGVAAKRVLAMADPQRKITEASETNNQGKAAGPFKSCQVAMKKLPLAVYSTYLKKRTLHLRLISVRKFQPDRKQLASIRLTINASGQRRTWTLAQADPTGRLRMLHRLDFNTRLQVKPGAKVRTLLAWPGGKKQKDFTLAAAPSSRLAAGRLRPQRTQEQLRTMVRTSALALMARGTGGGKGMYKSTDSGIHLSTPRQGQEVLRGSTLRISYRFLHDTPAGTVTFQLLRGDQRVAETTTAYTPRSTTSRTRRQGGFHRIYENFSWRLPTDLETGENYHVLVSKETLWSLSDAFKITAIGDAGPGHRTAWEIRLVTPGRQPVSWPRGSTQTIAWRIGGQYPQTRNFLVFLMRGGARVLTIQGTPRWFAPAQSYSMSWTIPPELPPSSDYYIKVVDRNGFTEGWSESPFSITGPIEVLYTPGMRYVGNPTIIRWRMAPYSGVQTVRVVLLDENREEVAEIARYVPAGRGEVAWVVGGNYLHWDGNWQYLHNRGPLQGPRAIRVMAEGDHSNYGQSQYFTIQIPIINITTSESNCRRGVRVSWNSPNLQDSVRLNITVRHHCRNCGHAENDPTPRAGGWGYVYISTNARPNGNFCWKFGTSVDGRYAHCCNLPCPHARIVAWPKGFREASMWSSPFEMDDRGCDDRTWDDWVEMAQ